MNAVTVTVKHELVTMTLAEAEKLADELSRAIAQVKNTSGEVLPPRLTCDGYLTYSATLVFFGQSYEPDSAALRNHAGKLFNRITQVAWGGGSGIKVLCGDCRQLTHEVRRCPVADKSHLLPGHNQMIEAASLKRNAEKFIDAGHKGVGSAIINDLRLLCDYL